MLHIILEGDLQYQNEQFVWSATSSLNLLVSVTLLVRAELFQ